MSRPLRSSQLALLDGIARRGGRVLLRDINRRSAAALEYRGLLREEQERVESPRGGPDLIVLRLTRAGRRAIGQ